MRNTHYKKFIAVALLAVLVLVVVVPLSVAHAQTATQTQNPNPLSCVASGSNVATCVVYFVSYAVNITLGVLVELAAGLLSSFLSLDSQVYSTFVQTGFSISLALANLAFVIAIIIIAIATILRSETYGVKKLLWKLVFMAILVNFGLVITRPIVGFADDMTNFFTNSVGGPANLVIDLTGALNPHQFVNPPGAGNDNFNVSSNNAGGAGAGTMSVPGAFCSLIGNHPFLSGLIATALPIPGSSAAGAYVIGKCVVAVGGDPTDNFFNALLFFVFSSIFLAIIAFTLLAIAILLLVRYIYLVFLLILLPFAWVAWIFPKFGNHFSTWWSKFIQWTIFPAVATFFIYLSLLIISQGNPSLTVAANGSSITQSVAIFISSALNDIVICGILLGGLFASQKLGIAGADIAIKTGRQAAGAVGGYVGKQGKKVASNAVPQKVKEKLQAGRYRFMPTRLQAIGGRALGAVERAGGADLVAKEMPWAKELVEKDPEGAKRTMESGFGIRGGVSKEKGMALTQAMHDSGKLQEMVAEGRQVAHKPIEEFLGGKGYFDSYGRTKLRKDIQEKLLLTDDIIGARQNLESVRTTGGTAAAIATAEQRLADEMEKVLRKTKNAEGASSYIKSNVELTDLVSKLASNGMSPADAAKVRQSYEDMGKATALTVGKALTPQAFSTFFSKMERADQLDEYLDKVANAVTASRTAGTYRIDDFFNAQNVNWIDNSPGARNYGVERTRLGI